MANIEDRDPLGASGAGGAATPAHQRFYDEAVAIVEKYAPGELGLANLLARRFSEIQHGQSPAGAGEAERAIRQGRVPPGWPVSHASGEAERLAVDYQASYEYLQAFVAEMARAGVDRNMARAWQ